jgi:hypothetical protein
VRSSTNTVGALWVEFDKSFSCCRELINPELGGFWLLTSRHSLCAYQAPVAKPVHTKPTPLADLCQNRAKGRQLNLVGTVPRFGVRGTKLINPNALTWGE